MRAGEVCNQNIAIIGKHNLLSEAARLMRDHHVPDVVVVESIGGVNIPIGMLTEHDIVISAIAEGQELSRILVGDLIHDHLLIADESDKVMITLKRMRHKGMRHIPVTSPTQGLLGVLSIDNILDALIEQLVDIDQIITHSHYHNEQLNFHLPD